MSKSYYDINWDIFGIVLRPYDLYTNVSHFFDFGSKNYSLVPNLSFGN